MTSIGTMLHTFLFGRLVGQDEQGNRYYVSRGAHKRTMRKNAAGGRYEKRWVIYHGEVEPSRIPAIWHGWMHYSTDTVPTDQAQKQYAWLAPNRANPTGSAQAYLPPGHTLKGGHRPVTAADYEPWSPQD